jgi:hypothetical protein
VLRGRTESGQTPRRTLAAMDEDQCRQRPDAHSALRKAAARRRGRKGAGERIRLLVTSSDFPHYDRNPNTGELEATLPGMVRGVCRCWESRRQAPSLPAAGVPRRAAAVARRPHARRVGVDPMGRAMSALRGGVARRTRARRRRLVPALARVQPQQTIGLPVLRLGVVAGPSALVGVPGLA